VLPFFIGARPAPSGLNIHAVIRPTPAIVSEQAVRRLPRFALILLCLGYVLAGFVGREPWKSADMTALGHMLELMAGSSPWLQPQILGVADPALALLPYWLGSWAIQLAPSWLSPAAASRIPFVILLTLTLASTWYATYYLARRTEAQPVSFAFGGEAPPAEYARAIADAALLAIVACLGLAQLSHETTPALAQLSMGAMAFFGMAALSFRPVTATIFLLIGTAGLTLAGAPSIGLLLALIHLAWRVSLVLSPGEPQVGKFQVVLAVLACLLVMALATSLDLWRWRLRETEAIARDAKSFLRLVLWFTWPAWPLALWTLWRWRNHVTMFHIGLPCAIVLLILGSTAWSGGSDRSLLLVLPALAALAAFALPTLERSVSAFIDWFTLLFFSGCALVIWLYWIAMQTGLPRRMAASVAKLTPGFEPVFQVLPFAAALAASLLWIWLVRWRVGHNRKAIWKSLVLPAGGAALCWLLLMTLWLPMLDFARSYAPLVQRISSVIGRPDCVQVHGLTPGQITAFRYHGNLEVKSAARVARCPWMLVDVEDRATLERAVDPGDWILRGTFRRPSDKNEDVLLFQRRAAS
jgi:hypothetical protein